MPGLCLIAKKSFFSMGGRARESHIKLVTGRIPSYRPGTHLGGDRTTPPGPTAPGGDAMRCGGSWGRAADGASPPDGRDSAAGNHCRSHSFFARKQKQKPKNPNKTNQQKKITAAATRSFQGRKKKKGKNAISAQRENALAFRQNDAIHVRLRLGACSVLSEGAARRVCPGASKRQAARQELIGDGGGEGAAVGHGELIREQIQSQAWRGLANEPQVPCSGFQT